MIALNNYIVKQFVEKGQIVKREMLKSKFFVKKICRIFVILSDFITISPLLSFLLFQLKQRDLARGKLTKTFRNSHEVGY